MAKHDQFYCAMFVSPKNKFQDVRKTFINISNGQKCKLKNWFSSSLFSKVEYFLEIRKVLLWGRANWRSRYAARGCRNSDGNTLQCNCKPQLGSKTITGIFPVLLIGGRWTSLHWFVFVYFILICQFVQLWEVSLVIAWIWRIKANATLGKS